MSFNFNNFVLMDRIAQLYENEESADVFFLVSDENGSIERIPGHKTLLFAVSDVFKTMLFGSLKEEGEINVTHVTASDFKLFLKFIYFTNVDLTMKNVYRMLALSHMYGVGNCFIACINFLLTNFSNENVLSILNVALLYNQEAVERVCHRHIAINATEIFETMDFLQCDKSILAYILNMDALSCTETELFEACLAWVAAKSKESTLTKELLEEYLGDLFYEIRFVSMSIADFASVSISHDFAFSIDEYKDILRAHKPLSGYPKMFNANPRQFKWDNDVAVRCRTTLEDSEEKKYYVSNLHEIIFSMNQPAILGAIVFNKTSVCLEGGSLELTSNLPIKIQIFEQSNKQLTKLRVKLSWKVKQQALLPEPVLIRPGLEYKINISSPEQHFFYSKNMTEEVAIDAETKVKFHNIPSWMGTDEKYCILAELKFAKF